MGHVSLQSDSVIMSADSYVLCEIVLRESNMHSCLHLRKVNLSNDCEVLL